MDMSNPPAVQASAAQAGYQAEQVARMLAAYGEQPARPPDSGQAVQAIGTDDDDTRPYADAGAAPHWPRRSGGKLDIWA